MCEIGGVTVKQALEARGLDHAPMISDASLSRIVDFV